MSHNANEALLENLYEQFLDELLEDGTPMKIAEAMAEDLAREKMERID